MLLLLQEPHLTTLFDLLEMLASFKPPSGEVAMEDSEVIQFNFIRTISLSLISLDLVFLCSQFFFTLFSLLPAHSAAKIFINLLFS